MNIFELQKNEHQMFLHMLSLLEQESDKSDGVTKDLIDRFKMEVLAHRMAEEETFFTLVVAKDPNLLPKIDLTKQEHKKIEDLLDKLSSMTLMQDEWSPTLKDLRSVIESDIGKEEQEFIKSGEKTFSAEEALESARQMTRRKAELERHLLSRLGFKVKEKLEDAKKLS